MVEIGRWPTVILNSGLLVIDLLLDLSVGLIFLHQYHKVAYLSLLLIHQYAKYILLLITWYLKPMYPVYVIKAVSPENIPASFTCCYKTE